MFTPHLAVARDWIQCNHGYMAAAYRAVVAERKEMVVVTIVCDGCGSEVSVDPGTAKAPYACPSCEKSYENNVREAVVALGRFHRHAAVAEGPNNGKSIFSFHIRHNA